MTRPGRLAQLEERFPYKEEVGGSSPSTPTRLRPVGPLKSRLSPARGPSPPASRLRRVGLKPLCRPV